MPREKSITRAKLRENAADAGAGVPKAGPYACEPDLREAYFAKALRGRFHAEPGAELPNGAGLSGGGEDLPADAKSTPLSSAQLQKLLYLF